MNLQKYIVHIVPNTGVTALVTTDACNAHQAQTQIMAEHPEARVTAVLLERSTLNNHYEKRC